MCNLLFLFLYSGEKPIESGDSWFPQRLFTDKPCLIKNHEVKQLIRISGRNRLEFSLNSECMIL